MAGIAGIGATGKALEVVRMLERLAHRGPAGQKIVEIEGCTLGLAWTPLQAASAAGLQKGEAADVVCSSQFASARAKEGRLTLERDPLGVAPLYYGKTAEGDLCFASEIKALLDITTDIHELPPGYRLSNGQLEPYFHLTGLPPLEQENPTGIASELRRRLETAIDRCPFCHELGSWLSGGLDSSVLAALARPHVRTLHSFVAGLPGAPDLEASRLVADYLGTEHHEILLRLPDLLAALPDVIYHLESFDALLVRSSITNYLAAAEAALYVPAVLSGEAADELFAGYGYLTGLPQALLPDELIDIIGRLHNTALQRVDRSASAHSILAFVPFADPDVVDYALRIPAEYKRRDGLEKWILRRAVEDALPRPIRERRKAKFWEGAGVRGILAGYAGEGIGDAEFRMERTLPNGWQLHSKEELLYYRIFREHFGTAGDLAWMGRTKGAPEA